MSSFSTGRRIDRRNRTRFFLLGLILLALGIAGLLIQAEILQNTFNLAIDSPGSYYQQLRELVRDYAGWAILALIVLGLLLFLWGLSWIRSQIATPTTKVRDITLQEQPEGATVLDAEAVGGVLARDLEQLPDVHDASARLVTAGPRPKIAVRATVDGAADLATLRNDMEGAYGRLRTVLGSESIESTLHVKPVPSRKSRVK